MKKQVILGLIVVTLLFGLVSSAQATTTIHFPTAHETISGNYTVNISTSELCSWVGLNYSTDNNTWYEIGANTSESTWFNISWNTTDRCNGNYSLNATSNRTESDWVNVTIYNTMITMTLPTTNETISGTYNLSATTNTTRFWVNFSYSSDNSSWTEIGSHVTNGTSFTYTWNTANISDGTYYFNATTNCGENETDYVSNVTVDNVADAAVDSPEFSTIAMAGLIGLLCAAAILLRKKKE